MTTQDKMVEIARFSYPAEAQVLMTLLKSEGIDCYLRNEYTAQVMSGYVDVGGARVEVLESEVQHALEVMVDGGYEIPGEEETLDAVQVVSGLGSRIPFLRRFSVEKQILIVMAVVAILLGLLISMAYFLA